MGIERIDSKLLPKPPEELIGQDLASKELGVTKTFADMKACERTMFGRFSKGQAQLRLVNSRIADQFGLYQTAIAVRELPKNHTPEMSEKMYKSGRWAPFEYKDEQGKTQTVLVNVRSACKRLGFQNLQDVREACQRGTLLDAETVATALDQTEVRKQCKKNKLRYQQVLPNFAKNERLFLDVCKQLQTGRTDSFYKQYGNATTVYFIRDGASYQIIVKAPRSGKPQQFFSLNEPPTVSDPPQQDKDQTTLLADYMNIRYTYSHEDTRNEYDDATLDCLCNVSQSLTCAQRLTKPNTRDGAVAVQLVQCGSLEKIQVVTLPDSQGRHIEIQGVTLGSGSMARIIPYMDLQTGIVTYVAKVATAEKVVAQAELQQEWKSYTTHTSIWPHRYADQISNSRGAPPLTCIYMPLASSDVVDWFDVPRDRSTRADEVWSVYRVPVQQLQKLHSQGVILRDIKPGNTLIHKKLGKPGCGTITDISMAVNIESTNSAEQARAKNFCGTAACLAPERRQALHQHVLHPFVRYDPKISRKSDVYEMGLAMLRSLTGRDYFIGTAKQYQALHTNIRKAIEGTVQIEHSKLSQILREDYPDDLELIELILNMVTETPDQRPTAETVETTLETLGTKYNKQELSRRDRYRHLKIREQSTKERPGDCALRQQHHKTTCAGYADVAEQLHALHQTDRVHGHVNRDRVVLHGFDERYFLQTDTVEPLAVGANYAPLARARKQLVSPEILALMTDSESGALASTENDIWAFGVCLIQSLTGKDYWIVTDRQKGQLPQLVTKAHDTDPEKQAEKDAAQQALLLAPERVEQTLIDAGVNQKLATFVASMVSVEPASRPTASKIAQTLKNFGQPPAEAPPPANGASSSSNNGAGALGAWRPA